MNISVQCLLQFDEKMRKELERVVRESSQLYLLTQGRLPDEVAVIDELMMSGPAASTSETVRFLFGIYRDAELIGLIDVLRGWKHARQCMVGLMLIREAFHGRGYGLEAYRKLEAAIRKWPRMSSIRAGVNVTNATALSFWKRVGFDEYSKEDEIGRGSR